MTFDADDGHSSHDEPPFGPTLADVLQATSALRGILTSARAECAQVDQRDATERAERFERFVDDQEEIEARLFVLDDYLADVQDPIVEAWRDVLYVETTMYALESGITADDLEFEGFVDLGDPDHDFARAWFFAEAALDAGDYDDLNEPDRPLSMVNYLRAITREYAGHNVVDGIALYTRISANLAGTEASTSLLRGLAQLDAAAIASDAVGAVTDREARRLLFLQTNRLQRSAREDLRIAARARKGQHAAVAAFAAFTNATITSPRSPQEAELHLARGYEALCTLTEPECRLQLAHRDAELHVGQLVPLPSADTIRHTLSPASTRQHHHLALLVAGMARIQSGRLFGALPVLHEAFRLIQGNNQPEELLVVARPYMFVLTETAERHCAEHLVRDARNHVAVQHDLARSAHGFIGAHNVALECVTAALQTERPGTALDAMLDAAHIRARFVAIAGAKPFAIAALTNLYVALRRDGQELWAQLCAAQLADCHGQRAEPALVARYATSVLAAMTDSGLHRTLRTAAGAWMAEMWRTQPVGALSETVTMWRERLQSAEGNAMTNLFERFVIAGSADALAERCASQAYLAHMGSADITSDDTTAMASPSDLARLRGDALLLRAETLSALGLRTLTPETFAAARSAFEDAGDLIGALECEIIERNAHTIDPPETPFGH